MDKSLFNIEEEYLQTLEELDQWFLHNEGEDEVPEEFLERLNVNKDEAATKLRNYKLYIDSLKAEQNVIKQEISRLSAIVKRKERSIEYMKARMVDATLLYGNSVEKSTNADIRPNIKLETPLLNITYIRQFPTVIKDEATVPVKYKTFKPDVKWPELTEEKASKIADILNASGLFLDEVKLQSKIDTKAINKDLKQKLTVPGAELDTEKGYIRIS